MCARSRTQLAVAERVASMPVGPDSYRGEGHYSAVVVNRDLMRQWIDDVTRLVGPFEIPRLRQIGKPQAYARQMTLGEITGGSPYGATIAGGDGSRKPGRERAPGRALPGPQDRGDGDQAAWVRAGSLS
jgi:hypothetical protein